MRNDDHDRRVLVMAPVGQDARAIAELLNSRGLSARICTDGLDCSVEINKGAGALLLTEEALETGRGLDVLEVLKLQPAWSELPVIILTTGGDTRLIQLLEMATKAAGTVTLLERPINSMTLLRSVEVALNSRRRQFQVRDLLEQQRLNEVELRNAHERLADRARELENLVQLRTTNLERANEQLRREMAEREALSRQLLNAQEEERRRIARELHDQMGQNLTALNIGLKSLQGSRPSDDTLERRVRSLQELAAQTARDLHRVALELRPSSLDDLGLVKSVRNLVETWSARCQIGADFEAEKYSAAGVSSEIETTLYRIIQEALNNVAKHSRAKHVSVILGRSANYLQVIIEDDGRGFDTTGVLEAAEGHDRLGLVGIKERLSIIGGVLNLESAPGHGTTLVVRVPVCEKA